MQIREHFFATRTHLLRGKEKAEKPYFNGDSMSK